MTLPNEHVHNDETGQALLSLFANVPSPSDDLMVKLQSNGIEMWFTAQPRERRAITTLLGFALSAASSKPIDEPSWERFVLRSSFNVVSVQTFVSMAMVVML